MSFNSIILCQLKSWIVRFVTQMLYVFTTNKSHVFVTRYISMENLIRIKKKVIDLSMFCSERLLMILPIHPLQGVWERIRKSTIDRWRAYTWENLRSGQKLQNWTLMWKITIKTDWDRTKKISPSSAAVDWLNATGWQITSRLWRRYLNLVECSPLIIVHNDLSIWCECYLFSGGGFHRQNTRVCAPIILAHGTEILPSSCGRWGQLSDVREQGGSKAKVRLSV